jgi:hypothetical protein
MSTLSMFCLPISPIQTNPSQHPPRCSSPTQLSLFTWQHFASVLPHAALTSPHLTSPRLASPHLDQPLPQLCTPLGCSVRPPAANAVARRCTIPRQRHSAVPDPRARDAAAETPTPTHTEIHPTLNTHAGERGREDRGRGQVSGEQGGSDHTHTHTQRDVDGERRVTHGRRIGT